MACASSFYIYAGGRHGGASRAKAVVVAGARCGGEAHTTRLLRLMQDRVARIKLVAMRKEHNIFKLPLSCIRCMLGI